MRGGAVFKIRTRLLSAGLGDRCFPCRLHVRIAAYGGGEGGDGQGPSVSGGSVPGLAAFVCCITCLVSR